MRIQLFLGLFLIWTSVCSADLIVVDNQLIQEDESEAMFTAEDGTEIHAEYVEVCRNPKTGRFVKCQDGNGGFISRKIEKRCRDNETGRFIKCP